MKNPQRRNSGAKKKKTDYKKYRLSSYMVFEYCTSISFFFIHLVKHHYSLTSANMTTWESKKIERKKGKNRVQVQKLSFNFIRKNSFENINCVLCMNSFNCYFKRNKYTQHIGRQRKKREKKK